MLTTTSDRSKDLTESFINFSTSNNTSSSTIKLKADQTYQTIRRNSFYYIMAQMSAGVKPEAKRIEANGFAKGGLSYSAFLNPDGSYALVFSNNNAEAVHTTIDDGSHHFPAIIPANGIVTLCWK